MTAQARFLEDLPDDSDLAKLVAAFERGDYACVRREAPRLAQQTENEEVRAVALELRERVAPDPLLRWAFLASAIVLITVIAWAYFGHGE